MTDPNLTPAGWYDDGVGNERYWDGQQWTQQTRPQVQTTTAVAEHPNALSTSAPTKPHILSWVALGVAVVGFIFACIPGALIVGWVLLPIAFVLSIVAFFLKGKKWPAITALITSIVGTIVGFVVFFTVVTVSFSDAFGGTETTITEPVPTTEASDPAPESEAPAEAAIGTRENPAAIGSTITGDEYTVVIDSVNLNGTDQILAANQFNEAPDEGTVYALITATVTYTGADSGYAAMVPINWVTDGGQVITGLDKIVVPPEPQLGAQELYNGASATGNVAIQIPADGNGLIRVQPGMLADDVFVSPR